MTLVAPFPQLLASIAKATCGEDHAVDFPKELLSLVFYLLAGSIAMWSTPRDPPGLVLWPSGWR